MNIANRMKYTKGTYKVLYIHENNIIHFQIVNLYTNQQYYVHTLWDIVKQIEDDTVTNKYPQSTVTYRIWRNVKGNDKYIYTNNIINSNCLNFCPISDFIGPTFIISILAKQNATWQGTIQWIEGQQVRQYRSTNELLKLMDDALEFFMEDARSTAQEKN